MDHSVLKKFAACQRNLLLAESDEKSAYAGFMRLCAATAADRGIAAEMLSKPQELRRAFFTEKCSQLAEVYGGIFSLYGELTAAQRRSSLKWAISSGTELCSAGCISTTTSPTGER